MLQSRREACRMFAMVILTGLTLVSGTAVTRTRSASGASSLTAALGQMISGSGLRFFASGIKAIKTIMK